MSVSTLARIPVVGALGYAEHVRSLPASFTATLVAEPDNRYFRHALAVIVNGKKAGYVAPEVAVNVFEAVAQAAAPVTCPGRRAARSDHDTSGVELLLDFSSLGLPAAE
jgi:hypothetical protein